MTDGIEKIAEIINNKYAPTIPYALIDYIEYIYGNVLYETLLIEINKYDFKNDKS